MMQYRGKNKGGDGIGTVIWDGGGERNKRECFVREKGGT